jgi:transcriptional regulator with XRE-family HTH domain
MAEQYMNRLKNKADNSQTSERKRIANRIRQAREGSHISQRALGKRIGVSDKAISSYEHGRSMPPVAILTRIALRTGKPLTFFTGGKAENSDIASKLKNIEKEIKANHALLNTLSKNKDNL